MVRKGYYMKIKLAKLPWSNRNPLTGDEQNNTNLSGLYYYKYPPSGKINLITVTIGSS